MDSIDVSGIEKGVQDLKNKIQDAFDRRVVTAKANLDSLESALSRNRNHHQAGVISELSDALTRLQERCSSENRKSVIEKIEQIQRLSKDPRNRTGWNLPKEEWPMQPDDALLSVSLCTKLVELQENAEALVSLSEKIAADIEHLAINE